MAKQIKVDKKVERKLKLYRKRKKCNLRISERCKSCEYNETCLNNGRERMYIISKERKAREMNHSKAKKNVKMVEMYDESYDESCDHNNEVASEPHAKNNESSYKCKPYEFACPYYGKECIGDGNCLYE